MFDTVGMLAFADDTQIEKQRSWTSFQKKNIFNNMVMQNERGQNTHRQGNGWKYPFCQTMNEWLANLAEQTTTTKKKIRKKLILVPKFKGPPWGYPWSDLDG